MADTLDFDVTGFQSLKAQIRDANIEYQKLVQAIDATPAQVQAAAQKVATLKDQLADANDNAAALTEQGKFAAFTKGLATISGGFTAVQGAIGLVDSDSKQFEKTLVKLQSAMALTQGLTALAGIKDAFIAMRIAAVSSFTAIVTGFRALAAAITTTGVGALIVGIGIAIGALVNYFNELSEAEKNAKKVVDDTTASLENQLNVLDEVARRRGDDFKIREAQAKVDKKSIEEISAMRQKFYANERDQAINAVRQINAAQDKVMANFRGTEEEKLKLQKEFDAKRQTQIVKRNQAETALELEKINLQQEQADRAEAQREKNRQKAEDRAKKELDTKVKNLEAQKALDLATSERDEFLALQFAKTEEEKLRIQEKFFNDRIKIEMDFERKREELRPKEEKNAVALEARLQGLRNQRAENAAQTEEEITKVVQDEEEKRKKAREQAEKDAEEKADKSFNYRLDVIKRHYIDVRAEELKGIENEQELEFKRRELLLKEQADTNKAILERYGEGSSEYMAAVEKQTQDEIQLEKDKKAYKIKTAKETFDGIMDTAKALSEAVAAINDRDKQRELEALKAKGLSEEQAAAEEDAINKKYFEKNKGVQIAQAIIQTLQSSVSAFAALAGIPVVGPALGAIAAAAALATGYATVQKIKETSYTSTLGSNKASKSTATTTYAEGGLLLGASHNMGGIKTSMGELEGGEFVMNRRATANFMPLLEAINSMGNTPGPELQQQSQAPIKTYVIATDVTSAQEANSKLQALARL